MLSLLDAHVGRAVSLHFRRVHTAGALGRSAAGRRQKCLELLTCSVCELRAGPDRPAWKNDATILGPFKQASAFVVSAPCCSEQLPTILRCADECPAKPCKSELCSCTKMADAAVCNVPADASVCWVGLMESLLPAAASQTAKLIWVMCSCRNQIWPPIEVGLAGLTGISCNALKYLPSHITADLRSSRRSRQQKAACTQREVVFSLHAGEGRETRLASSSGQLLPLGLG